MPLRANAVLSVKDVDRTIKTCWNSYCSIHPYWWILESRSSSQCSAHFETLETLTSVVVQRKDRKAAAAVVILNGCRLCQ